MTPLPPPPAHPQWKAPQPLSARPHHQPSAQQPTAAPMTALYCGAGGGGGGGGGDHEHTDVKLSHAALIGSSAVSVSVPRGAPQIHPVPKPTPRNRSGAFGALFLQGFVVPNAQ